MNDQSHKCSRCQSGNHEHCIGGGCVCKPCTYSCLHCRRNNCVNCKGNIEGNGAQVCLCERSTHAAARQQHETMMAMKKAAEPKPFVCSFCLRDKHLDCVESGCTCLCARNTCSSCRKGKCFECFDVLVTELNALSKPCTCTRPRHTLEMKARKAVILPTKSSGTIEPSKTREPEKALTCSVPDCTDHAPARPVVPSDMNTSLGCIDGNVETKAEGSPLSPEGPRPPPSEAAQAPRVSEDSTGRSLFDETERHRKSLAVALGMPLGTPWDVIVTDVRLLIEMAAHVRQPMPAVSTDWNRERTALIECIQLLSRRLP